MGDEDDDSSVGSRSREKGQEVDWLLELEQAGADVRDICGAYEAAARLPLDQGIEHLVWRSSAKLDEVVKVIEVSKEYRVAKHVETVQMVENNPDGAATLRSGGAPRGRFGGQRAPIRSALHRTGTVGPPAAVEHQLPFDVEVH